MKIGIFGGTFNPIHNGHINLVKEIIKIKDFDKFFVIPTNLPPHKNSENLVNSSHRIEMCKLAFNDEKIEINDYEIVSKGKSYTINTLKHFKNLFPKSEISLIIGSDMLKFFTKWKCFEEILSICEIIAVSRDEDDTKKMEQYADVLRNYGAKVLIINIKPYEISSTRIRNLISTGSDYACYLPQKIVKYIMDNELYK